MLLSGNFGVRVRHSAWRTLLILLAISAISLSIATRYVVVGSDSPQNSIKCQSLDAKRQHLLSDGLHWTAPAVSFIFLVSPKPSARIIHIALPLHELYSEGWLYNRPPPAC